MPGKPTLDIAFVLEQIGDAKELLQSVIDPGDPARRAGAVDPPAQ
jgi:hypothetical protein